MSKFAKIALLTLAAFLLLGFSITVTAKPGNDDDAPPAFDVNVVNEAIRVPFRAALNTTVSGTSASLTIVDGNDFPGEDYILVVETVGYRIDTPTGQKVRVLFVFQGDSLGSTEFGMPQTTPYPLSVTQDTFQDTMSFRSYVSYDEGNGEVTMYVLRTSDAGGAASANVRISGYFLPLDNPSLSP